MEELSKTHTETRVTKRQAIRAASSIGKILFGDKRWPDEEVPIEELQVDFDLQVRTSWGGTARVPGQIHISIHPAAVQTEGQ